MSSRQKKVNVYYQKYIFRFRIAISRQKEGFRKKKTNNVLEMLKKYNLICNLSISVVF